MQSRTLIRKPALCKMLGLGNTAIYYRLKVGSQYFDPLFPKPISLSCSPGKRGAVAWDLEEVEVYIETKKAARS